MIPSFHVQFNRSTVPPVFSPLRWNIGDSAQIAHRFVAQDVEAFVELCGDNNPLHLDEAYARNTLAGGRVVHGMLSAAWISTLIGTKLPGAGALWNRFSVDWKRMVRLGDEITFRATVVDINGDMLDLDFQAHRQGGEMVLEGKARVMAMAVPEVNHGEPRCFALDKSKVSRCSELAELKGRPLPHALAELKDQPTLLVTGATGGLGEAVVEQLRLSFPEAQLLLWGRQADKLESYASQTNTFTQSVDLANPQEVQAALEALPQSLHLAGLVHLAAAPWRAVPADQPDNLREMELHWKVGLLSYVQIVTSLRNRMSTGCSLVALSTQFALEAPPENCSAYISAKLAMEGYTRALAMELGPAGIRANMVAPSMINTPYVRDVPVRKKMVEAAKNPLRRLCTAQEVADTIVWLLGDKSSFINGATIPLTGGLSI